MKLITILSAFAGLGFAGHTASPAWAVQRRAFLQWDPRDAYENRPDWRRAWENRCDAALTSVNCIAGIMHKIRTPFIKPDGTRTTYLRVEGMPLVETGQPKKLRVHSDGTYEDFSNHGWTADDLEKITVAKNKRPTLTKPPWHAANAKRRKGQDGASTSMQAPAEEAAKPSLSWRPVGAYGSQRQRKRKQFWEEQCLEALSREGCVAGVIQQGQGKSTDESTGQTKAYIRVEGTPSTGESKKMRVYEDGSSEDFSKNGWPEQDRRAIEQGAVTRGPRRWYKPKRRPEEPSTSTTQQNPQDHPEHPVEASTGPQAPTHAFQPAISWHPPDAYVQRRPLLRESFEKACHVALLREGCPFGIIRKGYHVTKKPDGKFHAYINVLARKDRGDTKLMRLYEDGSSQWWEGPIPIKDSRLPRPTMSSKDGEGARSQAPAQRKRARIGEVADSLAHTQSAYPELTQAPGGGEYQHSATQPPTQTFSHAAYPGQSHAPDGNQYQHSAHAHTPYYQEPYPGQAEAPGGNQYQYLTQSHTPDYLEPHPGQTQALDGNQFHHSTQTHPPYHSEPHPAQTHTPDGGDVQDSATQAYELYHHYAGLYPGMF